MQRFAAGTAAVAKVARHLDISATIALAMGNVIDQGILEDIIEDAKPPLPKAAKGLHFLLSTPFRYLPPPPSGSRFRGHFDPAVFYGAEDIKTACAEAGYWRLRFWLDSEALASQPASIQMTLFEFHGATQWHLDLTLPPFRTQRKAWIHPSDYGKTQELAARARHENIEMLRSESARKPRWPLPGDPHAGRIQGCCSAFSGSGADVGPVHPTAESGGLATGADWRRVQLRVCISQTLAKI